MKTKWMIVTMLIGLAGNGWSQPTGNFRDKKEQIKAERKDFVTRWCGFTEAESGKFWQLQEEMEQKIGDVRKESRKALRDIQDKGIENCTEAELKKAMDGQHTTEQKILDLRWEYNQKFIDAVGVRKTARYYEGIRMFRKKLMERLRGNRMGDGGGGGEPDELDD